MASLMALRRALDPGIVLTIQVREAEVVIPHHTLEVGVKRAAMEWEDG